MHSRARAVEPIGWIIVAIAGAVMLTQAAGWTGLRLIAALQALTPYLCLLLVPVIAIALWRTRLMMVTVAAAVGFGALLLSAPLAFPDKQPDARAGATGLRVATANLLYSNDRIAEVAADLARRHLDVIVFNEYTPEHQAILRSSPLADQFGVHIDHSGTGAGGIAVWSRWPTRVHDRPPTGTYSLDVTVAGPDGAVRVVAVHPSTPLSNQRRWRHDLTVIDRIGETTTAPTLVIGDFNTAFWHPEFRRLLHDGFTDAHIAAGKGFTVSWPERSVIPAFVRLDHALTIHGLVSTAVHDFTIPGSDHRGFVVTVAPVA